MRFGVNYTPSKHWWHAWVDFDPDAIGRDLDAIAELSLDHVRVFPIWPVFQPNRGLVSAAAVARLVQLVRLAAERELDVTVDALQGHLSGFDFLPAWVGPRNRRDLFADPVVADGQALLLRTLATALRDEPNYLGLSIGNEPNNLVDFNPTTPEHVDAWVDTLLAAADEADPSHPTTCNAYDQVWYSDEHPFTPHTFANRGPLTCVHPWVFSGDCARRYGPTSTQVQHLPEYAVELARAYASDPARVTWVQEVGAPEPHIPVPDAPGFVEAALDNVATCERVWGVTWWCSHDVSRELLDYPELEYTLGLIDGSNNAKAVGSAVRRTVERLKADPPTPVRRTAALVLDGGRAPSGPGGVFFEAWMRAAAQGRRLAVCLRSDAAEHLAARGITDLVEVTDL